MRVYRFLTGAGVDQKLEQNGRSRSDSRRADRSRLEVRSKSASGRGLFPGHLFIVRAYRFLAEAADEHKFEQSGNSRSDSRSADQSPADPRTIPGRSRARVADFFGRQFRPELHYIYILGCPGSIPTHPDTFRDFPDSFQHILSLESAV